MPFRVLVAGLFHESHSFVAGLTRREDGDTLEGPQMLGACGDASPLGGALEAARELGWEAVPALDWRAMPGAIVADEVVHWWWKKVEKSTREALETGLDGVFLVLHGAMVSQSLLDVEGEVLERLRGVLGARNIPVAGVTDLHANFSPAMAQFSDVLVTYRKNPHTDAAESARRAALVLNFLMESKQRAKTLFQSVPLLLAPTLTATADEPMNEWEALARRSEEQNAEILAFNIHAGYAFADTPATGVSFSAVTTGEPETAQNALELLLNRALEQKELAISREPTLEQILPEIKALEQGSGPVLVVEPSDNIGGGAPGDATHILKFFLENEFQNAGVILNDPETVSCLQNAQIGEILRLEVGGKSGDLSGGRVEIAAELCLLHDGKFELEDAHSHLASISGLHIEMGPTALLKTGGIWILLTSHKTPPFDLGQWRCVGIDPEKLDFIGVKAAVAHRRAYDPIARASFTVATPGPCTSDLRHLPFQHLTRPIFPLNQP